MGLYQIHYILNRNPRFIPYPSILSAFLLAFLASTWVWPWSAWSIPIPIAHAGTLILTGTLLRELHEGARFVSIHRPDATTLSVAFAFLGEYVYLSGWLLLAGVLLAPHASAPSVPWHRTAFPMIIAILAPQLLFLQYSLVLNPAHDQGKYWLNFSAILVLGSVLAALPLGILLLNLHQTWWVAGLLWMYTLRTFQTTRRILHTVSFSQTHHALSPTKDWDAVRIRWIRHALYYSLTLLALFYIQYR